MNEQRLLGLVDRAVGNALAFVDQHTGQQMILLPAEIWSEIVFEVIPPVMSKEPKEPDGPSD